MDTSQPDADWPIDETLVHDLVRAQHPDLATRPIRLVDAGWDNVTYRLGDDLAVRVPRREAALVLLEHERRWLPTLARWLSVPIPEPVHLGAPTDFFPRIWNVVRWIPGATADQSPLRDEQAAHVARQLRALHRPAPQDAPVNVLRGEPLRTRDDSARERIAALPATPSDRRRVLEEAWSRGLAAEPAATRLWIHGDLHPKNVVVRDGALSGILDWGDMTSGDPATDLAAAWTLVTTSAARADFWAAYEPDAATVARARAWAVFFGAAMAGSGEPRHEAIGRGILDRVLADGPNDGA